MSSAAVTLAERAREIAQTKNLVGETLEATLCNAVIAGMRAALQMVIDIGCDADAYALCRRLIAELDAWSYFT